MATVGKSPDLQLAAPEAVVVGHQQQHQPHQLKHRRAIALGCEQLVITGHETNATVDTVDGRNPAPAGMYKTL